MSGAKVGNFPAFENAPIGALLKIETGEIISIPILLKDRSGFYILVSLQRVGDKLFKLHCNNPKCQYEWQGGVLDFWCPKCGTSDISAWLNPSH